MRRALGLFCCLFLISQYVCAQNGLFLIDKSGQLKVYNHQTIFFKNPFTITYGESSSTDNSVSFSFTLASTVADVKSFTETPKVGVCYARNTMKPTVGNGYRELGEYTDLAKTDFSVELKGLDSGLPWYCRACVTIGDEVFYGDVQTINTTGEHDGRYDPNVWKGFTYIDLGLPSGRLWSTENLGAGVPGDPGYYFAWGELAGKSEYTKNTYKFGTTSMSKYNNTDGLTELTGEDETATVLRGEYWQIPTINDFKELQDNCTWVWDSKTSSLDWITYGYTITGTNGKSIFLPAVGHFRNSTTDGVGYNVEYWTRNLYPDNVTRAYKFYLEKSSTGSEIADDRYVGMPIRPVIESEKTIWPSN